MKRLFISMIVMLFVWVAVTSHAQETKGRVGAHGAYSAGGDIEESNGGFGAQAELAITSIFSVEFAVSKFTDEEEDGGISLEQDLTTIGVSAVCRVPLVENVHGYLLAGMDYNIVDTDLDIDPAENPMNLDVDFDTDDEVGYHVGGGFSIVPTGNWELFAEY